MAKEITVWEAQDGRRFNSQAQAEDYDQTLRLIQELSENFPDDSTMDVLRFVAANREKLAGILLAYTGNSNNV